MVGVVGVVVEGTVATGPVTVVGVVVDDPSAALRSLTRIRTAPSSNSALKSTRSEPRRKFTSASRVPFCWMVNSQPSAG